MLALVGRVVSQAPARSPKVALCGFRKLRRRAVGCADIAARPCVSSGGLGPVAAPVVDLRQEKAKGQNRRPPGSVTQAASRACARAPRHGCGARLRLLAVGFRPKRRGTSAWPSPRRADALCAARLAHRLARRATVRALRLAGALRGTSEAPRSPVPDSRVLLQRCVRRRFAAAVSGRLRQRRAAIHRGQQRLAAARRRCAARPRAFPAREWQRGAGRPRRRGARRRHRARGRAAAQPGRPGNAVRRAAVLVQPVCRPRHHSPATCRCFPAKAAGGLHLQGAGVKGASLSQRSGRPAASARPRAATAQTLCGAAAVPPTLRPPRLRWAARAAPWRTPALRRARSRAEAPARAA